MFVVDESCALTDDEMTRQSAFVANMIERVKSGAEEPRLGYISCAPKVETVIHLDEIQYNSPFFPDVDVGQMSMLIRDRGYAQNKAGKPPRQECVKEAMASFMRNDARNKKVVLVSNCDEDRATSDTCGLVDAEIADYPSHIADGFANSGSDEESDACSY